MRQNRIGLHILGVLTASLLLGAPALAQSQQDQTFIKTAMEVNIAEIQIGQLASNQGATEEVKKFGQRLVIDHTRLEDELVPIAAKIGLTPPKELAPDDQALLTKLQGQSGAEFDDTFVHAMVKGHHQAIQLYKTEETSGQDPTVKNAARHGEPVIAEHLKIAEHLQSSMGKS